MRCEVVAIGTELLLGQIVDTNSSWIGEQLALVGIDSLYQVKVGDNAKRMEDTIRAALARSDAVICCGGLGPTEDDITKEVISKYLNLELILDNKHVSWMEERWKSRGLIMPETNIKQALIPDGFKKLINTKGTAPGLHLENDDKNVFILPGPPNEFIPLSLIHI